MAGRSAIRDSNHRLLVPLDRGSVKLPDLQVTKVRKKVAEVDAIQVFRAEIV